jgi:SAM-dependent methyltransferase
MTSAHPNSEWYKSRAAANSYADLAQGGRFPPYRLFARENITYADPPRTGLLVDGFAGTGIVTQLLREAGYQNEIVLIDINHSMLEKAKEIIGEDRTRFEPGDMLQVHTVVHHASCVIASQGAHRVPEERGGLPALLEAVYSSLGPAGIFVFNLDSTSIMLGDVPQLYEHEPYRVFYGEVVRNVAREQGFTFTIPVLEILACQFSRFSIERVLRFLSSSPFRSAEYLVRKTVLSRNVLEEVHFPLGTPQMIGGLVDDVELIDQITRSALRSISSHKRYQESWRGHASLDFHGPEFA